MGASVDERVVQMEFDNKDFEKAVSVTIKSLDELQNALKLDGSSKGIQELQKSLNSLETRIASSNVDALAEKFNKLGIVGVTALTNITNKAVDAGEKLLKSLTVDNISAGWNKFAENTKNIGTIVSQGFSMDETEEEMKRLLFFTDETSYAYTDMVNNISKFTAAGKGLHESINAMQGIALWASSAGQGAQKASQAMYQLSQAMGSGLMRKEDWKSIQNLNMDTQEFRKMALEAAEGLGTLKKVGEDTWQSLVNPKAGEFKISQFADHLTQDKWFTDEVMMKVYERYNSAVQKIYDYVEENEVSATQAIEALKDSIDPLALKWFKSAQEARTFGDAIEYVKEAVSTGWMRTFDLIFGNYEEATKLWTDFSELLYTLVVEAGDVRNSILEIWKAMGGREVLLEAFENAITVLSGLFGPIQNAWRSFFPDAGESEGLQQWADIIFGITEKIDDFVKGLRLTGKMQKELQDGFTGLFSVLFMVADGFKAILRFVSPLATPLNILLGIVAQLFGAFGRFLSGIRNFAQASKTLQLAGEAISNAFQKASQYLIGLVTIIFGSAIYAFNAIAGAFHSFVNYIKQVPILGTIFGGIVSVVSELANVLGPVLIAIGAVFVALKPAGAIIGGIAAAIGGLVGIIASVISTAMGAAPIIAILTAITVGIKFGGNLLAAIPGIIAKIISYVQSLKNSVAQAFNLEGKIKALSSVRKSIVAAIAKAKEFFNLRDKKNGIRLALTRVGAAFDSLKNRIAKTLPGLKNVKTAIANLVSGIVNSIKSIRSFDDLKQRIGSFVSSFFSIDGITKIVQKFGSAISGLVASIAPTFGKFADLIGGGLSKIGQLFSTVISNFKITGILSAIVTAFKTFADVILTAVGTIIPPFKNATEAIKGFIDGIASKVGSALDSAKTIGEVCGSLFASLKNVSSISEIAKRGLGGFLDFVTVAFNNLKAAVLSFVHEHGLDSIILKLGEAIGSMYNYIKQLSPAELILLAFGIAMTKFSLSIANSVSIVSNAIANMLKSVADLPKTISKAVKSITDAIKSRSLASDALRFATAIGILAASLFVLSNFTDIENLKVASAIIVGLALTLAFAMKVIGEADHKAVLQKAIAMEVVAGAVLTLTAALKLFSYIPWPAIIGGMAAFAGMVAGMIAAVKYVATIGSLSPKAFLTLIELAFSMDLLAAAIVPLLLVLKFTTPEDVQSAILILITFIVGMAGLARSASGLSAGSGIAVVAIVASIFLLIGAFKAVAESGIDFNLIKSHFESYIIVFGALGLVMFAAAKIAKTASGFGVAIAGIAFALNTLTKVIKQISEIKFDSFWEYAAGFFTFMTVLGVLLAIMKFAGMVGKASIKSAVAFILIAGAMRVLVFTMDAIKKLTDTVSGLRMAGIMLVFAILGAIMSGMLYVSQFTGKAKLAPMLVLIAGIGLMIMAIALVSRLPKLEALLLTAAGLGVFFLCIADAFETIAKASETANTGTMAAFVMTLMILVGGMAYMSQQDWKAVAAAGIGLAAAMYAMGQGLKLMAEASNAAKGALKGAGVLLVASLAIIPAAYAISLLKDLSWGQILAGAAGLAGVIIALANASSMASPALITAVALDLASPALIVAAYAISMLAGFDPLNAVAAAAGLAGVIIALAKASSMAAPAIVGALALDVTIPSMVVAAYMLGTIAAYPWEQILAAAAGLAGVIVTLGASSAFAAGAIFGAVALDIASISLLAASYSLSQIAALPTDKVESAVWSLIKVMAALAVGGFIASIPPVTVGLVVFAGALVILSVAFLGIAEATAIFAGAVTQIIMAINMLSMMSTESITQIGANLTALGTAIGQSFAAVIEGFFTGIINFIGGAIGGIIANIAGGIATIFGFKDQFFAIAGNLIGGLIEGLGASWEGLKTAVENLGNGIVETIKTVLGVHSPSTILKAIMEFFGLGGEQGLVSATPGLRAAADTMGNSVIDKVKGIFSFEAGGNSVLDFVTGMKNGIANGISQAQEMINSAGFNFDGLSGLFGDSRATTKLKDWTNKTKNTLERQIGTKSKFLKEQVKIQEELANAFKPADLGGGGGGGGGGSGAAEKATKETKKQIDMLTKIVDYASGAISMFRVQWAETAMGLEDTTAQQASKDALELLAFQLYENSIASETAEEAAERMAKTQAEVAADIKKAYVDMRNGVNESLRSSINVFKMADNGEKIKGGDLLERARSNRTMVQGFTNDLKTLAERIKDMPGAFEMLSSFAKDGTSRYGDLGGMLDMATDELTEFMDIFYHLEVNPHELNEYTDSIMGSLAYVGAQASGGFATGLNTEEGAAAAENYSNAVLDKFREKFGVNLQGDNVSEATKQIAEAAAKGFTETLQKSTEADKAEESGEKLGAGINEAVGGELSAANGNTIGKALCEGIAKGITENTQIAIDAATAMGLSVIDAVKTALQINSPSKVFEDLGYYSDAGLATGFVKYGTVVREAAAESALGAVDEFTGVFGQLADLIDGRIDLDPTIRPVLDLSNLTYGSDQINSLLGLNDPYPLNASVAGIQNSADLALQLGDSINKAINRLKETGDQARDIVIHIYPTENQSPEEIADAVSYRINHELYKKVAVRGGT